MTFLADTRDSHDEPRATDDLDMELLIFDEVLRQDGQETRTDVGPALEPADSEPTLGETVPPSSKAPKKRKHALKLPDSADDMTDAWHARRFVDLYGHKLRFCLSWGKWLVYDGQRWLKDDRSAPLRLAMDSVQLLREHVTKTKGYLAREGFLRAVRRAEKGGTIASVVKLAQADERVAVRPHDFDQDHFILNCPNGTLDLKADLLRPHDPADMLTKLAPINYVPSAACPTWERFLDRIMGGEQEMIDFIQRALGYALTGDVREECMFVFYGLGQNGKSKLLGAAQSIAGDYAGTSENHLLTLKVHPEHPTAIANLAGKRLVVVPEPNQCQFDDARVKWLTGGDTITSRKMHQDFSDFKLACKFFVMSNHKPKVRDLSEGFWRRMNLVEFSVAIPPAERDNDLTAKLMAEAEGILAWMVRGCLRWQEKGLDQPAPVREATREYRDEMDTIGTFLEACCILAPDLRVNSTDLWSAYREWCNQECLAHVDRIQSQTQFGKMLTQRGITSKPSNGRTMRLGVALKTPSATPFSASKMGENRGENEAFAEA